MLQPISQDAQKRVVQAQQVYDRFLLELEALREERRRFYARAVQEVEEAKKERLRKKLSVSL